MKTSIIEAVQAEVIGTYQEKFYRDTPVVVKNSFGLGQAYYLASRTDRDFLKAFYTPVIEKMHLANTLIDEPQFEVSVQTRVKEGINYHFLMNFSTDIREVALNKQVIDVESAEIIKGIIILNPYEVRVLRD